MSRRVLVACAAGALAVSACAAVIGIGELPGPVGADAGSDGDAPGDAPSDAPAATDASGDALGDAVVDAGPSDAELACRVACEQSDAGRCDGGSCVIDCRNASCSKVTCPPGVPCAVFCGSNRCNEGVDCSEAGSCNIECSGMQACKNGPIKCGGSDCRVACSGTNSCWKGIDCQATESCNIACTGNNVCRDEAITCSGKACTLECNGTSVCDNGSWRFVSYADVTTVRCDGGGSSVCGRALECRGGTSCSFNCAAGACGAGDNCCGADICDASAGTPMKMGCNN